MTVIGLNKTVNKTFMFALIFAILLAIVLIVRFYELIKYKEKLDSKTILYLVLASLAVIAIFLERIFDLSI